MKAILLKGPNNIRAVPVLLQILTANSQAQNSSHKSGLAFANNAMQRWGMTNAGGKQFSINQQHESFDITMMEANNLMPRATLSHNIMEDQQN